MRGALPLATNGSTKRMMWSFYTVVAVLSLPFIGLGSGLVIPEFYTELALIALGGTLAQPLAKDIMHKYSR